VAKVSSFSYGETQSAKVEPEVLAAHAPTFRELTKLCANLAFKKSSLKAAFLKVARESKFEALSTEGLVEDWVQTVGARSRIACRHVATARIQQVPPRWLQRTDGAGMAALADSGQEGRGSDGPGVIDLTDSGRQAEESEDSWAGNSTPEDSGAAGDQPVLPGGGGNSGHAADEPPGCPEAPAT
jgi:hypothetical protein